MWGNVLRVLKVRMGRMVLGKEMHKEDYCSSVMKKSCAWQTHDSRREKEITVRVDVKQKLVLRLLEKIQKVC